MYAKLLDKLTVGMSGVELAYRVLELTKHQVEYPHEQRQKSIDKAQAEYLMMLANALRCKAEDLIEPVE